jgi:uncharacterized membrane protein
MTDDRSTSDPRLGIRLEEVSRQLLGASYASLDPHQQRVAQHLARRTPVARNIAGTSPAGASFGQRAADAVASFGGSWTFVGLFAAAMIGWVGLNAVLAARSGRTFDPYPYILLNLFLSMLAAIQAPIILMSQNRQSEKDRISAEHDYEVNLKAELELLLLHAKIDGQREQQWNALLELQREQLALLKSIGPVT